MAIALRTSDRAEVLRELARELLDKADALDGHLPCVCGGSRAGHDPAGWNQGWCDGIHAVNGCKCEEFEAW